MVCTGPKFALGRNGCNQNILINSAIHLKSIQVTYDMSEDVSYDFTEKSEVFKGEPILESSASNTSGYSRCQISH